MGKVVDNIRQFIDLILVWIGATTHYLMQVVEQDPEVLLVYINIGVGITIIIFTLIRMFFWIKNQGANNND